MSHSDEEGVHYDSQSDDDNSYESDSGDDDHQVGCGRSRPPPRGVAYGVGVGQKFTGMADASIASLKSDRPGESDTLVHVIDIKNVDIPDTGALISMRLTSKVRSPIPLGVDILELGTSTATHHTDNGSVHTVIGNSTANPNVHHWTPLGHIGGNSSDTRLNRAIEQLDGLRLDSGKFGRDIGTSSYKKLWGFSKSMFNAKDLSQDPEMAFEERKPGYIVFDENHPVKHLIDPDSIYPVGDGKWETEKEEFHKALADTERVVSNLDDHKGSQLTVQFVPASVAHSYRNVRGQEHLQWDDSVVSGIDSYYMNHKNYQVKTKMGANLAYHNDRITVPFELMISPNPVDVPASRGKGKRRNQ